MNEVARQQGCWLILFWHSISLVSTFTSLACLMVCWGAIPFAVLALLVAAMSSVIYIFMSPWALYSAIRQRYLPGIVISGTPVSAVLLLILSELSSVIWPNNDFRYVLNNIAVVIFVFGGCISLLSSLLSILDIWAKFPEHRVKMLGCGKHHLLNG